MGQKVRRYEGDFETTTNPEDVRVWASCLVDIDSLETAFIGNNIESFFHYLKDKNSIVYMHNLKFDGEFILWHLLTHGYKYSEVREDKTFDMLVTDDGLFYQITVIFKKKGKRYNKVVFYDSYKKLPFKVSVIAKAFELPDRKMTIDYKAERPVGHILTPEEEEYIVKDCRIVANALQIQFAQGLNKMTNASDALHGFKDISGRNFDRWFPVFPLAMDKDMRRAYKGGFVYLNPKYKNKRVKLGKTYDVNSLYPWVMYTKLLPYGYPMFFEGKYERDENYPLYIVHMKCCFRLKEGHIPCIQLKNNRRYVETEYLTTSEDSMGLDEPVEMWLTNVDYELMLDHYDIFDETYINGWKFKGATGMFKDYIDFWMNVKENNTGALRQLAKLMLNSLYGKFASNPEAYKRVCYLDENEVVRYEVVKDKEIAKKYGLSEPEPRDPVYTPMGCFITAYAREKTIRSAQREYDRFIYADTDSLHLEGLEVPDFEIHPTHLGAWKDEGTFVDSKYIRAKTYMESMQAEKKKTDLVTYANILNRTFEVWREDDRIRFIDTKVTCAGMPDNVKQDVTYNNFASGSTFEGKLMPRRYRGGIVLEETTFTIK